MRPLLIAVLTGSLFATGCGGDTAPEATTTGLPDGLECPSGEDDLVGASFDLGADPRGFPSPRVALAHFLDREGFPNGEGGDLNPDEFTGGDSTDREDAELAYSRDGHKLAHVFLRRLDRGWLVIGYEYCRGQL